MYWSSRYLEITRAIKKSIYDDEYKKQVSKCINPYGDGDSSKKIAKSLLNYYKKEVSKGNGDLFISQLAKLD